MTAIEPSVARGTADSPQHLIDVRYPEPMTSWCGSWRDIPAIRVDPSDKSETANQRPTPLMLVIVEPPVGIEPTTFSLRVRRSAD